MRRLYGASRWSGRPLLSGAYGDVAGKAIITIEAVGNGKLHPVQEAWIEHQVPQCGYCQTGQIMQAISLLEIESQTDRRATSTRSCRAISADAERMNAFVSRSTRLLRRLEGSEMGEMPGLSRRAFVFGSAADRRRRGFRVVWSGATGTFFRCRAESVGGGPRSEFGYLQSLGRDQSGKNHADCPACRHRARASVRSSRS